MEADTAETVSKGAAGTDSAEAKRNERSISVIWKIKTSWWCLSPTPHVLSWWCNARRLWLGRRIELFKQQGYWLGSVYLDSYVASITMLCDGRNNVKIQTAVCSWDYPFCLANKQRESFTLWPCGRLVLQLYHLISTTIIHGLYTIMYSFNLCQKIIFHKVSDIFQRAKQQFFAGHCWHFLNTELEAFLSHATWCSEHFCTNMKGQKGITIMCLLTTWSIPLDNRFKELETTCTKPSWIGIKQTQFQCFCLIESILLQFSDNTLVLSLTDCTKKVFKALNMLMGTQLKRTSCQDPACVRPEDW